MKPKLFIASSSEGVSVAYAIQENLESACQPEVWNQVFELTEGALDQLVGFLERFDFGVFVFTPDDVVQMRDAEVRVARDNVVLELGLFVGHLGKQRTFVLMPRGKPMRLPSDLIGLTLGYYDAEHANANARAALGPACNRIQERMKQVALKPKGWIAKEPDAMALANAACKLAEDLPQMREKLGERTFILRRMPCEFTEASWRILGLDTARPTPKPFAEMRGYQDVMRDQILLGAPGGSDYWDYTIMGKTGNAEMDQATRETLAQWYFSEGNEAPDKNEATRRAAANTSGLALFPGAMSDGIFLIGEYDDERAQPDAPFDKLLKTISWDVGYHLQYGPPLSQHMARAARTTEPQELRWMAAQFAIWWTVMLREEHPATEPPPPARESYIKLDVDAIHPVMAERWREFLKSWYGS